MTAPPRKRSLTGVLIVLTLVALGLTGAIVGVKYSFWTSARPTLAPVEVREALEEAVNQAVRAARVDTQLDAVEDLARRYPRDPKVRSLLAKVYTDLGRSQEALAEFQASLELDGHQPGVEVLAGTLQLNLGDAEAAREHYARAVKLDPNQLWYRYHLAHAERRLGQYDGAALTLLDAIKRNATKHYLYAGLCELYKERNQISLALTAIDSALKHSVALKQRDDHVAYLRDKARLLMRDTRPAEALEALSQLSDQEQLDPDVIEQLAVAWQWEDQPERGADLYEHALRTTSASPDVAQRYAVGAVRWSIKAGDRNRAEDNLERLRAQDPHAAEIGELATKIMAMQAAVAEPAP